jgi:hypothetical protein
MPVLPLDITYEMFVSGAWVDITSDVRQKTTTIVTGRDSESDEPKPGSCRFTLDNQDLKYSPRNPLSPYYGQLKRNTPLRVTEIKHPAPALAGLGNDSSGLITPFSGDMDIRVQVSAEGDVSVYRALAGFFSSITGEVVQLALGPGGVLQLAWIDSAPVTRFATATAPINGNPNNIALRATLDVDAGSGNSEVRFYESSSISGTWTQIGSAVLVASTGSLYSSVNTVFATGYTSSNWTVQKAEYRNGIGGTVVASPDFGSQAVGPVSFTDAQGVSWANGTIVDGLGTTQTYARFYGEISSWEPKWNETHSDCYVPIEASGILRRLKAAQTVRSALRWYVNTKPEVVNYWPMEDGPETDIFVPDIGATGIWTVISDKATSQRNQKGELSDWLPNVMAMYSHDEVHATVDMQQAITTNGQGWNVSVLIQGDDEDQVFLALIDCKKVSYLIGVHYVDNFLDVSVSDGTFVSLDLSSGTPFSSGSPLLVQLTVTRASSTTSSGFISIYNTETGVAQGSSFSIPVPVVQIEKVALASNATNDQPLSVGHLIVNYFPTTANYTDLRSPAAGYPGEKSHARVERLADEQGVAFSVDGDTFFNTSMGRQYVSSLLEQLAEIATTTDGFVVEALDGPELVFSEIWTHTKMTSGYPNPRVVSLNYSTGQIAPPFEPIEDDRFTRNDVTVKRTAGGEYRAVQETGSMSVQNPEDGGVGRYDVSYELNTASGSQAAQMVGWLLSKGTLDVPRFPSVTVDLLSPAIDDIKYSDVISTTVSDWLRIEGLDEIGIYEPVELVVIGYEENLGPHEHTITFNCVPADLLHWSVVSLVGAGRMDPLDSDDSSVNTGVNSTATSLSVKTTGALWTHADGDFDILVGGERMTVTNVTGSSSPQTFTVTRSVNGVVKSQVANTPVELADPTYIGVV